MLQTGRHQLIVTVTYLRMSPSRACGQVGLHSSSSLSMMSHRPLSVPRAIILNILEERLASLEVLVCSARYAEMISRTDKVLVVTWN